MAVLHVYQADLLKNSDLREGVSLDAVLELRHITDLALRATKREARAIGRTLADMVATERHLWLNLAGLNIFP